MNEFDIVIIGGGHAGAEAAWAACRLLAGRGTVALVTMDPAAIGRMSCNPAIGGLAKGQMVREIDALGGLMAHAIDATGIQFRMLNRSKGPAVWSPRAQADKYRYAKAVQQLLRENCPNLTVVTGIVDRILTRAGGAEDAAAVRRRAITGVVLEDGRTLNCQAVVITTGTFLRGLMHTGEKQSIGGRVGEQAATGLTAALTELGFVAGRLKTGTPPRLAADSVDFAALEEQHGDDPPEPFSYLTGPDAPLATQFPMIAQRLMHITHTNERVHELIRKNLHRAPMFSGQIHGRGPRYCPSIEDKIVRFAEKASHQIFLEPESLDTDEIYCNGISTSLPADVQIEVVHAIKGLEKARVLRWGYAVEYDFFPPEQINATLETRLVAGLYFAGQINGTSGYEEAAGQGLIAGVNAARQVRGEGPWTLTRDQAYLGVMVDDLITKTLTEPYRMFTSRAEFRLSLRSDNADQRLTPIGAALGLAEPLRIRRFEEKAERLRRAMALLEQTKVSTTYGAISAFDMLRRPEANWREMALTGLDDDLASVMDQVAIEARYMGYVNRERQATARLRELDAREIPAGFDFAALHELRAEARQALVKFGPQTLGQASRLEGITPNDLMILNVHLSTRRRRHRVESPTGVAFEATGEIKPKTNGVAKSALPSTLHSSMPVDE